MNDNASKSLTFACLHAGKADLEKRTNMSMPPADRRRGQRNDAMHRPRRDKNAEAFLNETKRKETIWITKTQV